MSEPPSRPLGASGTPVTGSTPTPEPSTTGPTATAPTPTSQRPPVAGTKDPLRPSRASGVWIAVVALVVLLTLLSIFVLQNTRSVHISFLSWDGNAPLAAMLLIATALGLMIAVAAGALRILQLRTRVRRAQKG